MPRLAVCSRDLHWHWINWTLLCDTMEVSMLRLAWLPIAQHVFQPALIGRLELISRKIVSGEQEERLSRWADFAKNCLPRIECKELPRFREKYRALGRHVCKIREICGQKNGVQHATAIYPIPRYTRPRYIGLTLYQGIMEPGNATPGIHFTINLRAHHWNLAKILFAVIVTCMIQSDHKCAHVTTAQLLWHVQICDLIGSLF